MGQREQRGHIFEAFGSFHVRYWVAYNDLPADEKEKIARKCEANDKPLPVRVQKSKRICAADGHKEVTSKSVRLAAQKVMDEVNGLVPGETILPDLTVAAYWDKHFLPWAEAQLKPSTVYGYKQIWGQHLKPHLGKTLLKGYSTGQATKFLTSLADTQGKRTISHIKWTASKIFGMAVSQDYANENPWPQAQCLVRTPKPAKGEVYSITEALGMLAALDRKDAKLALALACFAGLRKGEISTLRWEDFLPDGRVRIERNLSRNEVVDTTKTGHARMGLIIEPVTSLLQAWREACGKPAMGWLFPNGRKNPMSLDSLAQRVIIPKIGDDWKGWHAGRRGCSTILTELTGDALAARDILGHTTTKVTEQHYIGDIPEAGRKGMAALEAKLKSLGK
jgi:integrase